MSFINKNFKGIHCILFLIGFFFLFSQANAIVQDHPISPATQQALEKFQKRGSEVGRYGSSISERLLICSYLQDIWLEYLLEAESVEVYHQGMQLLDNHTDDFKDLCNYMSNVFNFYKGSSEIPFQQRKKVFYKGQESSGFLNTYKMGHSLTEEERSRFFSMEESKYLMDCVEKPFILDAYSINQLQANTIYNYVLLPNGTIVAALERPGEKEYHVRDEEILEAFKYPNHTILAGTAQQVVMTAGALVLHQVDGKRLFFVSCKSGHFQPTYRSLSHMPGQLAELGVNPYTVVCVPDVDIAQVLLDSYHAAKVPILLTKHDTERLFKMADKRWKETYWEIDRNAISALAEGNFSVLNMELIQTVRKQRAEATYMRSAFRLFSANHIASENFNELVKRFGKLKDAIKHFSIKPLQLDRVQSEAKMMIELMKKYDSEMLSYEFVRADDASFYDFLQSDTHQMNALLSKDCLSKEEYHDLKKLSRELYAFFMYLSQDSAWKGRGFHIYQNMAEAFFQINDLMAKTDYIYVSDHSSEEIRVKIPRKILLRLVKNITQLSIAPSSFEFKIDEICGFEMINKAKDLYTVDYYAREFLRSIMNEEITEQTIDWPQTFTLFNDLLRCAEVARNAMIFLDRTHQVPELFHTFIDEIPKAADAAEKNDFAWMKEQAEYLIDLCYYAPSMLQNWECADQPSFNEVLKNHLQSLKEYEEDHFIHSVSVKNTIEQIQAFRDLVNLYRKIGVHRRDNTQPQLPMQCFDALEEHADGLLDELREAIDDLPEGIDFIRVTPRMHLHAAFILSRNEM